jgi:hypothetical protein
MRTKAKPKPQRITRSSTRGVQKPARATRVKSNTPLDHPTKTTIAANKRPNNKRPNRKVSSRVLQEYHERSDLDPNGSTNLFHHPREIFDNITGCLSTESLICLSLTCKLALQYIGASCWTDPQINGHEFRARQNLMHCLARDAPPHLSYCEYCNTMHPPLLPPRSHCQTKLTKKCMSQWAVIDYFPQVRPGEGNAGYSLLHRHISEVFENREAESPSTDILSGNYATTINPKFDYTLDSSASWIHRNLVLQHVHTFRPKIRSRLQLKDILSLPVQLCPHHSTTTARPLPSQYLPTRAGNAPLLTHAITGVFPPARRIGLSKQDNFRTPTPLEQKQMTAADGGEDVIWKCRGCTTKFDVLLEGQCLVIKTWHSFGTDIIHASNYWPWLVRRDQANLGAEKRNSEFWYQSRSVPDFKIE